MTALRPSRATGFAPGSDSLVVRGGPLLPTYGALSAGQRALPRGFRGAFGSPGAGSGAPS